MILLDACHLHSMLFRGIIGVISADRDRPDDHDIPKGCLGGIGLHTF